MHPEKEGIFNTSNWWASDTTIEGGFDTQAYAQLLRSISMKCGIVLGIIYEANAALRNNYFATTEEPRVK